MIVPWADEILSGRLAELCAAGESSRLEFKQRLPEKVRHICSEVAAFATSGGGLVLLGVADNGTIEGLSDIHGPTERDQLIERLRGSIRANIKPPLKTRMVWAVTGDKVVLAIDVGEQSDPVFYFDYRPYVRDHSTSRPAEPGEVLQLVREFDVEEEDPLLTVRSELAGILTRTLAWLALSPEARYMNPTLDEWRFDCQNFSSQIDDLLLEHPDIGEAILAPSQILSQALEEVADIELTLGCGGEIETASESVSKAALALHEVLISNAEVGTEELEGLRRTLGIDGKKLAALADRAKEKIFYEPDEIRAKASETGQKLVRLSFYNLNGLGSHFGALLREIGLALWDIETRHIYMDGGLGLEKVVLDIADGSTRLERLVERDRANIEVDDGSV